MAHPAGTTVDFGERAPDAEPRSEALTWVFPPAIAGSVAWLAHGATLGRADTCTIQVDCEGVSRWHVVLAQEGAALLARDCGSTNGTFLDGRRIRRARLYEGGVLRLGSCIGIVGSGACGALPAGFGPIASRVWGGDGLRRAIEPARRAAPSRLPVLLVGENGTGKAACARAIHEWSGRPGRFLAMSCTAVPKDMAEAELFGYWRGAFMGALSDSTGYFRSAHRGTLLLEDVDELPLPVQAKLLRVLQEQVVTPLGQADPVPIDVRVLCASQVPLARAVTSGTFRGDLLMGLKGLQVELPPLRARRADIAGLFQIFLVAGGAADGGAAPAVHARVVEALCLYSWPGNVRELELVAQRLLALHSSEPRLDLEHLPPELRPQHVEDARAGAREAGAAEGERGREDLQRLASKLRQNGANLRRACAELGISRQRAYRLLEGRSVRELLSELGH
jgi:transcriptional regulator with AAA-type ATPase domain